MPFAVTLEQHHIEIMEKFYDIYRDILTTERTRKAFYEKLQPYHVIALDNGYYQEIIDNHQTIEKFLAMTKEDLHIDGNLQPSSSRPRSSR